MADLPGLKKPDLQALPQIRERISFLYVEHCKINRQDGAITLMDARGTVHVPGAGIGVLLLGPGSSITHRAMELLGDAGASILWVGERGVRYYAHGRPLAHGTRLLIRQAALVSNTRSRLAVARQMYQLRFPEEQVNHLTMQQLRGREGARVRGVYRQASRLSGVSWDGRRYEPDNFEAGSDINKALSAAHACLYGVCHSVIVALGCAPGLGFVHTGHERSFVYDIADLYKAEITIPLAFMTVADKPRDLAGEVRRRVRDEVAKRRLMEQAVRDIRRLLLGEEEARQEPEASVIYLWDERLGQVSGAVSYAYQDEEAHSQEAAGYGRLLEG
ncbi:MAG: type I-E CRISPR-associated endonuclease Cas1 [Clostridiales bacterium]|nr:type I-E CRISPR-associated endonuclease Cas1 [Clostridiales bacterium]